MSDDLKTPWHLRPASSCPPNLTADYSDVFDSEGSLIARVCQENAKGYAAAIVAAPELLEAAEEFRDAVLHERHALAEMGMDSDQVNAVLDLFDDTIGNVIAKAKGEA